MGSKKGESIVVRVIGVRFKRAGKVYYFDPGEFALAKGDQVIVETARGIEYGEVAGEAREVTEEELTTPLKRVIRMATAADTAQVQENRAREKEAFSIAGRKIGEHKLEMDLVDVEYTFDGNKIIFYFTAEGRVDFRELVRDLAAVFRTRIELRQIGVRDEAKMLGGIGPCGRLLCCSTFLGDFAPVSIKMAKEQNLSLNPTKISGLCGRLLCCLRYESEHYESAKSAFPSVGTPATTADGAGRVAAVNVIKGVITVELPTGVMHDYPASAVKWNRASQPGKRNEAGGEQSVTGDDSVGATTEAAVESVVGAAADDATPDAATEAPQVPACPRAGTCAAAGACPRLTNQENACNLLEAELVASADPEPETQLAQASLSEQQPQPQPQRGVGSLPIPATARPLRRRLEREPSHEATAGAGSDAPAPAAGTAEAEPRDGESTHRSRSHRRSRRPSHDRAGTEQGDRAPQAGDPAQPEHREERRRHTEPGRTQGGDARPNGEPRSTGESRRGGHNQRRPRPSGAAGESQSVPTPQAGQSAEGQVQRDEQASRSGSRRGRRRGRSGRPAGGKPTEGQAPGSEGSAGDAGRE